MASYYFVIKNSRLLMIDQRIMLVMEIIRLKTFAVVQKSEICKSFLPRKFHDIRYVLLYIWTIAPTYETV